MTQLEMQLTILLQEAHYLIDDLAYEAHGKGHTSDELRKAILAHADEFMRRVAIDTEVLNQVFIEEE